MAAIQKIEQAKRHAPELRIMQSRMERFQQEAARAELLYAQQVERANRLTVENERLRVANTNLVRQIDKLTHRAPVAA